MDGDAIDLEVGVAAEVLVYEAPDIELQVHPDAILDHVGRYAHAHLRLTDVVLRVGVGRVADEGYTALRSVLVGHRDLELEALLVEHLALKDRERVREPESLPPGVLWGGKLGEVVENQRVTHQRSIVRFSQHAFACPVVKVDFFGLEVKKSNSIDLIH